MTDWARAGGHAGPGHVTRSEGEFGGPIAKNPGPDSMAALFDRQGLGPDDGCLFAAGKEAAAAALAGAARTRVATELGLAGENAFRLCWIVDFPTCECDEETGRTDFSPQSLFHAARRTGSAGNQGPAGDPGLAI